MVLDSPGTEIVGKAVGAADGKDQLGGALVPLCCRGMRPVAGKSARSPRSSRMIEPGVLRDSFQEPRRTRQPVPPRLCAPFSSLTSPISSGQIAPDPAGVLLDAAPDPLLLGLADPENLELHALLPSQRYSSGIGRPGAADQSSSRL